MKITTKQAKNVRPVTIYSFTFHCYSTELLSIHTEKKKTFVRPSNFSASTLTQNKNNCIST